MDKKFDEVYQLAADMGGAGYIFTGNNDADVMHNSATINLNMLYYGQKAGIKKYSIHRQLAFTLNTIRWILIILNAQKNRRIRLNRIVNMAGKNYLAKDYIFHFKEIME